MLTGPFIQLLYEAASIQRWNDHIRPSQGFTELDKQGQKMLYAYVLARFEEDVRGVSIDWVHLVEGGLFELLHRIKLTDIKPPVFHRLMAQHGPALNEWVIGELGSVFPTDGFQDRFAQYFRSPDTPEKQILKAAHYLATQWEFGIIYHLNQGLYGLDQTREDIENQLENHSNLVGVQKLALQRKTYRFMDLVGQLRFQQRWAHSPRVPTTSVLGHMLVVALFAYLTSETQGDVQSYFRGLFHDLPEALTRDIVSPVKRSIQGLEDLILEIEREEMESVLLPLLPAEWADDIRAFTLTPTAGVIKTCDELAAFVEACLSMRHGITSDHLLDARSKLYRRYAGEGAESAAFQDLFAYFYQRSASNDPAGRSGMMGEEES